jgi:hypothetical protein
MKKVYVSEIDWDINYDCVDKHDLVIAPEKEVIEFDDEELESYNCENENEIYGLVLNRLSDMYGYHCNSCVIEEIK